MKKRIFSLLMSMVLVLVCALSTAAADITTLSATYGDVLSDVVLPEDFVWDYENPATVSVGNVGPKTFNALDISDPENEKSVRFDVTVEPAFISEVSAVVDGSQFYTGNPVVPEVKAVFKGEVLTAGQDYTIIYSDNINVGTAKITIEGIGNFKGKTVLSFSIIKNDVEGVVVYPEALEMVPGKTASLSATVYPDAATFKGVSWESSDPSVATVDDEGVVTAHSLGSSTITARTNDGSYSSTATVNVVTHDNEEDHKYVLVESVSPECVKEGMDTYICSVCDKTKKEVIPAKGHNYVECYAIENSNYHRFSCSDCEKNAIESHSYSEWISNGDAGIFKDGTESTRCLYCELSLTRTDGNSALVKRIIVSIYEFTNNIFSTITEILNDVIALPVTII